jgi:hypothetical protein
MYLSSVLDFNSDLSSIQKSKLMKEKESVFPPYFFRPFISLQRWENFNFWEKIRSFFLHGESQEDKKNTSVFSFQMQNMKPVKFCLTLTIYFYVRQELEEKHVGTKERDSFLYVLCI